MEQNRLFEEVLKEGRKSLAGEDLFEYLRNQLQEIMEEFFEREDFYGWTGDEKLKVWRDACKAVKSSHFYDD